MDSSWISLALNPSRSLLGMCNPELSLRETFQWFFLSLWESLGHNNWINIWLAWGVYCSLDCLNPGTQERPIQQTDDIFNLTFWISIDVLNEPSSNGCLHPPWAESLIGVSSAQLQFMICCLCSWMLWECAPSLLWVCPDVSIFWFGWYKINGGD